MKNLATFASVTLLIVLMCQKGRPERRPCVFTTVTPVMPMMSQQSHPVHSGSGNSEGRRTRMIERTNAKAIQCCITASGSSQSPGWNSRGNSGTVPMVNLQQLQHRTQQPTNDTLLVVNFWATWCAPCVEELPFFLQATKTFAGDKVKIIFVSLDFIKDHNKLSTFVADHKMENEVYHLNAGNPNNWIDKIDSSWGGSIPATVMYRHGIKTLFHEGELNQQQLDSLINKSKP